MVGGGVEEKRKGTVDGDELCEMIDCLHPIPLLLFTVFVSVAGFYHTSQEETPIPLLDSSFFLEKQRV